MMFYNHDFHVNVFINDVSTVVKTHNRKNDVCIFQLCAQQRAINLTGANPVCEGLANQQ